MIFKKALTLLMVLAMVVTMAAAVSAGELAEPGDFDFFDDAFDAFDGFDDFDDFGIVPISGTDIRPTPPMGTWYTPEGRTAAWECSDCGVEMSGMKPDACPVCLSEDIKMTSDEFFRLLTGNIRTRGVDALGNEIPAMDPTMAFFIIVGCAFLLGTVMSMLYKGVTKKGAPSSKNFAVTLIILPMVIATVIFVIGQNMAAAFGLAGVFAMTRFRSASANSKDLTFVFVSVALGLSCGMGFVFYGFAMTVILCIVLLALNAAGYGEPKSEPKLLRINVPESISYSEVFDAVLEKYAYSWDVSRVKTVDLGATFEITYNVMMKNGINEKEFIDELRTRNGNLNIILRLDDRRERGQM